MFNEKGIFFSEELFPGNDEFFPTIRTKIFIMPLRNILLQVEFPHETRKYLPAFTKNDIKKFPYIGENSP